jgi:hypothetical protein
VGRELLQQTNKSTQMKQRTGLTTSHKAGVHAGVTLSFRVPFCLAYSFKKKLYHVSSSPVL